MDFRFVRLHRRTGHWRFRLLEPGFVFNIRSYIETKLRTHWKDSELNVKTLLTSGMIFTLQSAILMRTKVRPPITQNVQYITYAIAKNKNLAELCSRKRPIFCRETQTCESPPTLIKFIDALARDPIWQRYAATMPFPDSYLYIDRSEHLRGQLTIGGALMTVMLQYFRADM